MIILALAVISIFGTGASNVIIATVPFIPRRARVVRSSALAVRETPYIDAARASGFGHVRIIARHMLPNVLASYLVVMTAGGGPGDPDRGIALLSRPRRAGAGPGLRTHVAGWGAAMRRERAVGGDLPGDRHLVGGFGFNLFGDALRDWPDPKMQG